MRCKGLCHDQCTIVPMTPAEVQALQVATGRTFDCWPAHGIGDDGRVVIVPPGQLRCPVLGLDNRCTAYAARPALCRLYGEVEAMPCSHGCRPARWTSEVEAARMLGMPNPEHFGELQDGLLVAMAELRRRGIRSKW